MTHIEHCPTESGMAFMEIVPSTFTPPASIETLVRQMCRAYGHEVHDTPHKPEASVRNLRQKLATEEFSEYQLAEKSDDLYEILGELADQVIIAYGTSAAYGVLLDEIIREKLRANMDKVMPDGTVLKNADGKVVPPPGYRRADYTQILSDIGEWAR